MTSFLSIKVTTNSSLNLNVSFSSKTLTEKIIIKIILYNYNSVLLWKNMVSGNAFAAFSLVLKSATFSMYWYFIKLFVNVINNKCLYYYYLGYLL